MIQQVFGDRVQLSRADADVEDLVDLSRRFSRFDLVAGRSLGLGGSSGTSATNGQSNSTSGFGGGLGGGIGGGLGGAGALGGIGALGINGTGMGNQNQQVRNTTRNPSRDSAALSNMSSEEIQALENQLAQDGKLDGATQADLMQRREGNDLCLDDSPKQSSHREDRRYPLDGSNRSARHAT